MKFIFFVASFLILLSSGFILLEEAIYDANDGETHIWIMVLWTPIAYWTTKKATDWAYSA